MHYPALRRAYLHRSLEHLAIKPDLVLGRRDFCGDAASGFNTGHLFFSFGTSREQVGYVATPRWGSSIKETCDGLGKAMKPATAWAKRHASVFAENLITTCFNIIEALQQ